MFKLVNFGIAFLCAASIALSQSGSSAKHAAGVEDFLKKFYDISSLPAYESNSFSAEVSTYDRTGLNNDGFAGTYSYVRRNPDSSLTLFDIQGAGLINRIWTPTPSADSLDFYIDDTAKVAFTICYHDLFSGKVYPFVAPLCANQLGGYYCYLPIPFNKSCKIIFRGKATRFHQIGYRLYPKGTVIDKFQLPFTNEARDALSMITRVWEESLSPKDVFKSTNPLISTLTKTAVLNSGEKLLIFERKQGGRILGFEFSSSAGLEKAAKDIDLKISWDNASTPAIYCPLADYFGYAFGKPSMKSLLIGNDGEKNYSYFPMPFDASAKIELVYRKQSEKTGDNSINLHYTIFISNEKRDTGKEGKFYAFWDRKNPVPLGEPYPMLNVNGKGHFVGVALQAQGLKSGMTTFFEGDDSTVVDGELRMHGTGSEDFFNGGWYALLDCWDAAMSLPLSGALTYSIPLAHTGGYRLFITDKISFEKSIFQSIEHGPDHNLVPADYTSVAYYYCDRSNLQTVQPSGANTVLHLPDTLMLYPQLLNIGIDGDVAIKTNWAFPTGGLTFFYTVNDESIIRISLQDVPAGNYKVYLDYVTDPASADFSVWQRQTQLSEWHHALSDSTVRVDMKYFSELAITPLNNSISFRFKTAGNQNKFILNRIVLIKK